MTRSYSESSDDDEVDVSIRHSRHHSPAPPRRQVSVASPAQVSSLRTVRRDVIREREPRNYYQPGPVYIQPERTIIPTRRRSPSLERRSLLPSQAPAPPPAPVIIHIKIINEHSDSDGELSDDTQHRRRHSHRAGRSRTHSGGSSTGSFLEDAREKWELEQARRELDKLRMANARERDERLMDQHYREEAKLQQAKRDLDENRRKEAKQLEVARLRKEIELTQLEQKQRQDDERKRCDREAQAAVEKYKLDEAQRLECEKREKMLAEKEYQRRLQQDLFSAGVDEKGIEAILKKVEIKREQESCELLRQPHAHPTQQQPVLQQPMAYPTYTRMSLRHLDVETLIRFNLDYEYDQEPGYILIRRWVPEWEQDLLWEDTRKIRAVDPKRDEDVVFAITESKKPYHHGHHDHGDKFEWVRKKERRRSKSPGLLKFLAGGRPS